MTPLPDTIQEFFWDDLLECIKERGGLPIIGAEPITVLDDQGKEAPLTKVLASKLAERLRVSTDDIAASDCTDQAIAWSLTCYHV